MATLDDYLDGVEDALVDYYNKAELNELTVNEVLEDLQNVFNAVDSNRLFKIIINPDAQVPV